MAKRPDNETTIRILEQCAGLLTPAAEHLMVNRRTLQRWIEGDQELQDALEDIKHARLDFSETQLEKNIAAGKEKSIIWFLSTIGKDRGFTQRTEQEHILPEKIVVHVPEKKDIVGEKKTE